MSLAAVDQAWSMAEADPTACPVLVDWWDESVPVTALTPAARLVITSPEAARMAAEALYADLTADAKRCYPLTVEPRIEDCRPAADTERQSG